MFISQRRHLTHALSSGWEEPSAQHRSTNDKKIRNKANFVQLVCNQLVVVCPVYLCPRPLWNSRLPRCCQSGCVPRVL